MLELRNVSWFYSSNGMVSTGFSRVSLTFNLLVGLLPTILALRKTPAEIMSRSDI